MHIPFAVLVSLALTLPILAAPVVRDTTHLDVAAPVHENQTIAVGDEFSLEARAVKVKAAAKPAVKAKAVTKKPVAKAPVKAVAKPAAKTITTKPKAVVAKPKAVAAKPKAVAAKPKTVAAKPKVVAAKPKTVAAKPKAVATKPKAVAAKPVVKKPTTATTATAAQKAAAAKAAAAKAKASASAKAAVAKPSASAAASCAFKPKAKKTAVKKTRDLFGRTVSTTQFHATCKTFAASIAAEIKAGTFALQAQRIWPNEFTWTGGFYVTPDEEKAQLFGATFLANTCKDKGGVVVMEFKMATSALEIKEVAKADVNKFRTAHGQLGQAFLRFLKKQIASDAAPPDPPADEGIGKDDSPAGAPPPQVPLPSTAEIAAQIEVMKTTKNAFSPLAAKTALLVQTFEDFKAVDVVAGAGPLTSAQKVLIADAGDPTVGIPPLTEPFNQVVLVTDKAMKSLTFVKQEALPECLAAAQPKLVALLLKKGQA